MNNYRYNPDKLTYERTYNRHVRLALYTLVGFTVMMLALSVGRKIIKKNRYVLNPVRTVVRSPVIKTVTGTYYHALSEQTDSRPLETADGSHIDRSKLRSGRMRWIALSRDLIDRHGGHFSYGDRVYVYHPDRRLRGWWVLRDTMNKRFKNRIDFLVHESKDFPGLTKGILISKVKFV